MGISIYWNNTLECTTEIVVCVKKSKTRNNPWHIPMGVHDKFDTVLSKNKFYKHNE